MARDEVELALERLGISRGPEDAREAAARGLAGHGDFAAGFSRLSLLSGLEIARTDLDLDAPESELDPRGPGLAEIEGCLRALSPWRKGPFSLSIPGQGTLSLDGEWRSDLKWRRVLELGASLSNRRVLDVGTGNGYFLLRLLGAGASSATGLEPSLRSILQFLAVRALFGAPDCSLWPLRLEDLPPVGVRYDTVMSMGVLYHQRDPTEHLRRLRRLIVPGGELILETIVQEATPALHVEKGQRYAGMRNVYVIPSASTLRTWLDHAGFDVVCVGAPALTTSAEQRTTSFAPGPSLSDVLDSVGADVDDPARNTCEGHPRPTRLALRATPKDSLG
jgi:tRNA (mo5U34)-methyltransferase